MSAPIPLPISSGSPRHHYPTRKFHSASAPKPANSLQTFPSFVQRSRLPEQDKNYDEIIPGIVSVPPQLLSKFYSNPH